MSYILKLHKLLKEKKLSALELTNEYIKRIKATDKDLGAYITLCEESAAESAKHADKLIQSGENISPLCGIPFSLKDNISTKGNLTTCGSKMLENYIPPFDATVTQKLYNKGAILLGKVNTDEFAMGSGCESSYFKATKNPVSKSHVPGGSSGGSAACVGADQAVFSLGSDTGGSIRQPASFCGVCGMSPTYGRVSRYGLIPLSCSLDRIGPLTRYVYDNALILNEISGKDKNDATSRDREAEDFTKNIDDGIKGMTIGILPELFSDITSKEVADSVICAIHELEKLGAKIISLKENLSELALASYYVISSCEASSNLSRFDGVRFGYFGDSAQSYDELYKQSRSEGFGEEVKRRILAGTLFLSEDYYEKLYKKASGARNKIINTYKSFFENCDIILSPTCPTTAHKLSENKTLLTKMYENDIYTCAASLANTCAISIPCGKDKNLLPIGLQLIGKPFDESRLYKAAFAFEKQTQSS